MNSNSTSYQVAPLQDLLNAPLHPKFHLCWCFVHRFWRGEDSGVSLSHVQNDIFLALRYFQYHSLVWILLTRNWMAKRCLKLRWDCHFILFLDVSTFPKWASFGPSLHHTGCHQESLIQRRDALKEEATHFFTMRSQTNTGILHSHGVSCCSFLQFFPFSTLKRMYTSRCDIDESWWIL